MAKDKSSRGNSSQFFVAGELCRQGHSAVVTLGNCPNTDILVSNIDGTKFVHVQVKTFVPGNRTCSVGLKAEKDFGPKFFWVIAGIPLPNQEADFEYFIIPSKVMALKIKEANQLWLDSPGKHGQKHNEVGFRTVHLPPHKSLCGWDIRDYKDRWDLIGKKLKA